MADNKKSFVMYGTWAAYIAALPDAQAAQLIKAISCYQIGRQYEIKDPAVKAFFDAVVLPEMKGNEKKYQDKVDRISDARKKADQKSDSNQSDISMKSDSNQSDISSVTDTVTVTVNDTVSDIDKERVERESGQGRSARPEKTRKYHFGEYGHVLLSDAELSALSEKHGTDETMAAIKAVDEYCEAKGKTYKNYALALEKWGYQSVAERRQRNQPRARSGTPPEPKGDILMDIINGKA